MSSLNYALHEMPDNSMLAAQFSMTDRVQEEYRDEYRIRRESGSIADEGLVVENLIPDAIRTNWYLLSRSKLPERAFNDLMTAASSHERTYGGLMKPLSWESLRGFLGLWKAVRDNSAEPVLSISPTGDVIAEWFSDPDNSLVIMATGDGDLIYSLFDRGKPCEGTVDSETLGNMIAMFLARDPNPFGWSDADEG